MWNVCIMKGGGNSRSASFFRSEQANWWLWWCYWSKYPMTEPAFILIVFKLGFLSLGCAKHQWLMDPVWDSSSTFNTFAPKSYEQPSTPVPKSNACRYKIKHEDLYWRVIHRLLIEDICYREIEIITKFSLRKKIMDWAFGAYVLLLSL